MRKGLILVAFVSVLVAAVWFDLTGRTAEPAAPKGAAAKDKPLRSERARDARMVSREERQAAIARAQVWHEPVPGAGRSNLPPLTVIDDVSCRFVLKRLSGTTPKFNCRLDSGEEVRIKYGKGPEIPAEAAATRLLRAIGFGADEITLVRHLRCYGCPLEPFATSAAVQTIHAGGVYEQVLDYDDFHDFDWVALERKYDAWPIEAPMVEGWAFPELDHVKAASGGAPRAHVDALRLVAVFLAHWDNKSDNQRLVCDALEWPEGQPCATPLMMLQDLGATFGPRKISLRRWRTSTIWADRKRCRITMRHLPYSGATFQDTQVSEEGRQLASRLLSRLTDDDVATLFRGARFDQRRGLFSDVRPVEEWVEAFTARVRVISEGSPCPPV